MLSSLKVQLETFTTIQWYGSTLQKGEYTFKKSQAQQAHLHSVDRAKVLSYQPRPPGKPINQTLTATPAFTDI